MKKETVGVKTKYLAFVIAAFAIIIIGYFLVHQEQQNILDINLKDYNSVALHIHPTLEIEINGQKYLIPNNTGISNGVTRVIHTHDDTGRLHIESPVPHQFYLRDFFAIWGKTFNRSCIVGYCVDENHTLSFLVNEQPNDQYENLPLNDMDNITIIYA